jgi:hypothetical protein
MFTFEARTIQDSRSRISKKFLKERPSTPLNFTRGATDVARARSMAPRRQLTWPR